MVDNKENVYLRTQVMTARPEQLTLMLFDGAIRFAERGRACLGQGDFEGSFEALNRAERIVMELLSSLRPETAPEICRQQAGLYLFVYSKLVEANMRREARPLEDALRVLGILRETWTMLMKKQADSDEASPAPPPRQAAVSIEG